MNKLFWISLVCLIFFACNAKKAVDATTTESKTATIPGIPNINETFLPQSIAHVSGNLVLNGAGDESAWEKARWRNIDQLMLGAMPSKEDFSGRYKLLWDEDMLYVLAEIHDDVFMDINRDGLDRYWDDDCLEVFVDADKGGEIHQYNYNAFAYHLSLDDRVVDIGDDRKPQYFDDHIEISKTRNGNMITWELGIKLYSYTYSLSDPEASRVKLSPNKSVGFMLAYCDNDYSKEREHFIGDMFIEGEDKNRGWIDASVFGNLRLEK